MGALHEGPSDTGSLAKRRADRVVVSIFVNPAQFAPHEDFGGAPPQTWDADSGVGSASRSTRSGRQVPRPCIRKALRPRSFPAGPRLPAWKTSSVRTSSAASVPLSRSSSCRCPDFATFGEKDYRQLRVVTAMARDLDIRYEDHRRSDGAPRRMVSRCRRATRTSRRRARGSRRRSIVRLRSAPPGLRPASRWRPRWAKAEAESIGPALRWIILDARHAETLAPVAPSADGPCGSSWRRRSAAPGLIDNISV